ncbi:OmpA family protein [Ferruginibacter sp. SUN106]|uniref:OmpA family protein n=1 Tax=Ferruginibacter sp. SUN106 TaxID=2978348 RepID=UPI003D36630A
MKKLFTVLLALFTISFTTQSQVIKKISSKVKNKASQRADQKVDNAIDKGLDKTEAATKTTAKKVGTDPGSATTANSSSAAKIDTTFTPVAFTAYNNYDFVPGEKILFEDNFMNDQVGEFPAHWHLGAGQATINNVAGKNALLLTAGNFAHVSPLMKSKTYLPDAFTIEYDSYSTGGYGPHIYLYDNSTDAEGGNRDRAQINMNSGNIWNSAGYKETDKDEITGEFPKDILGENYWNKWHHIAIAYKAKQLKIYIDQYRVLVIPNIGITPRAFDIEGIGDEKEPVIMTNFRIADGAGMNMLGKKFTDTKIVTHGINFDVNKANIKPESMGTLNSIVQIMKDNPDIKFEVGGHTDSDGDDVLNLKLSQARADAVRSQLISMGIDAARLTAKGFGKTKPISDNTTPEGKANNRRVEFVKK